MGRLFCGQNNQGFAINGVTYAWPKAVRALTFGLGVSRLGPLSDMDLKQVYLEIFEEINTVIDLPITYVSNHRAANFLVIANRIDGPSGTLAQAGIPMPHFNQNSQLTVEWDDAESYVLAENPPPGKIDIRRVGSHEALHLLGLGHAAVDRRDPALIEPQYNERVRYLQPRDKKELLRRYPPAKIAPDPVPAPTPAPIPAGDKLIVEELRVAVGGKRYKLSGSVGALPLILDE